MEPHLRLLHHSLAAATPPAAPFTGSEPGHVNRDHRFPDRVRVIAGDGQLDRWPCFDTRSRYLELFWLPILGPSATLLLRRLGDALDALDEAGQAVELTIDLDEVAQWLGLGGAASRHAPLRRAVARCVRYRFIGLPGPDTLAVRRWCAPLSDRQQARLPEALRDAHRAWVPLAFSTGSREGTAPGGATTSGGATATDETTASEEPVVDQLRSRARTLAGALVAEGVGADALERHLCREGVHPAMAFDAAGWALGRRGSVSGAGGRGSVSGDPGRFSR